MSDVDIVEIAFHGELTRETKFKTQPLYLKYKNQCRCIFLVTGGHGRPLCPLNTAQLSFRM